MTSILITGGTGSLGRALVSDFLQDSPFSRIIVYSRDEWKQSQMAEEFKDSRARYFLGDVRDRERLRQAMSGVGVVVHAAALKRVDSVSYNPSEVIKTNVLGTMNVVSAAIDSGVGKVVVVSSDKAVNPQNIYGASKFLAESYAVNANSYGWPKGTRISCVRYGNVLGSRGSMLWIFKRAMERGEPVPITDKRATRFLITMREAVGMVKDALAEMEGGETFVPYLAAFKVVDFAEALAPERIYSHRVIGSRPGGEKLHESLLNEEETGRTRWRMGGKQGYVVLPSAHPWTLSEPRHQQGRKVEPFVYRSDVHSWQLSVEEIRVILEKEGFLEAQESDVGGQAFPALLAQ